MNTIRLKPKYEKIKKDLIRNNEDTLHRNSDYNKLVKHHALMIAQGLQLSEEYSEKPND